MNFQINLFLIICVYWWSCLYYAAYLQFDALDQLFLTFGCSIFAGWCFRSAGGSSHTGRLVIWGRCLAKVLFLRASHLMPAPGSLVPRHQLREAEARGGCPTRSAEARRWAGGGCGGGRTGGRSDVRHRWHAQLQVRRKNQESVVDWNLEGVAACNWKGVGNEKESLESL